MFLENPHLAVPGGRRRRRRARANADQLWLVHYAVAHLMKTLRYSNPGINVRLPSHIAPPFRASAFHFTLPAGTTAPVFPGTNFTVTFNGQSVVPEGLQGVISELSWLAFWEDADLIAPVDDTLLTIRRNGVAVPGFLSLRAGYDHSEGVTDIAGTEFNGVQVPSPKITAPIHLKPGDVIEVNVTDDVASGTDPNVELRLSGWLYPIEVEADGIVGTMADRGGPMPRVQ